MRFHRQPPTQTAHDSQGEIIGYVDRRAHVANAIICPVCEARPGGACRGQSPLVVHQERMTRFLSS